MKIEIPGEVVDEIVRKDLEESILLLLDNAWEYAHSYTEAYETISGLFHAYEYYSTKSQQEDFYTDELFDKLFDLVMEVVSERN